MADTCCCCLDLELAEDAQTFATQAKLMTADFTVAPIPTNYGRITYDGSIIHIS